MLKELIDRETKSEMITRMKELTEDIYNISEKDAKELKDLQKDWMDDTMRRAAKRLAKSLGHVKFTPAKKKRKKTKRTHR